MLMPDKRLLVSLSNGAGLGLSDVLEEAFRQQKRRGGNRVKPGAEQANVHHQRCSGEVETSTPMPIGPKAYDTRGLAAGRSAGSVSFELKRDR